MRFIDRSRVPTPPSLLSDETRTAIAAIENFVALPLESRLQRRAPIRNEIIRAGDVRESLMRLFLSKCAFCERQSAKTIEQFRPPRVRSSQADSHYAWLAYDWENLYACCEDCNKRKADLFPVDSRCAPRFATVAEARRTEKAHLIDPCFDDPRAHLALRFEGHYAPLSNMGGYSIELLGLNRMSLVQERRDLILKIESHLASPVDFFDAGRFLDPAAPFSGAAIQFLSAVLAEATGSRPRWSRSGPAAASVVRQMRLIDNSAIHDAIQRLRRKDGELPYDLGRPTSEFVRHARRPPTRSASIRSINVENFKGIERLRIVVPAFHSSTGETGCLMLLGENSAGKSSVLEALALALVGVRAAPKLTEAETLLRRKGRDRYELVDAEPVQVTINFHDREDPVTMTIDPLAREFKGETDPAQVVIAYGSRRYSQADARWKHAAVERVKALFRPAVPIADSGGWLQYLFTTDPQRFYAVARGLRQILALRDDDDLVVDDELGVCVRAHGRLTPLDRMSEGYRSLFAMSLDMMRELLMHSEDLESARGVVLIDEVETHLHPRWKVRVMAALRSAMPNVTFIATTHDPLCLRGMDDGEVVVLFKDDNQRISKVEDLPSVKGMRAEQLLTSDFFGLNSTSDPEVDRTLAEYVDQMTQAQSGSPGAVQRARELGANLADTLVLGDTAGEQVVQEALGQYLAARRDMPPPERSAARREVVSQILTALRAPLET